MKKLLILTAIGALSLVISPAYSDNSHVSSPLTESIETNFLTLNKDTFQVEDSKSSLVVAATGNNIFTAVRDGSIVKAWTMDKSILNIKESTDIMNANPQESKIFVLDLLLNGRTLFVSYVRYFESKTQCDTLNIAKIDLTESYLFTPPKNIFQSTPCVHWIDSPNWTNAAGRLAYDGKSIYISGGLIFENLYSNRFPEGSIFGLPPTLNEAISSTNVFGGVAKIEISTKKVTKIASGLREPQGLFWDKTNSRLWETEQGPRGGDELNNIQFGKNYGWPFVSLGRIYDNSELNSSDNPIHPKYGTHSGYEPPVYSWTPSIAASQLGMIGKLSSFADWWRGNLVVSSLKDLSLHRLALKANKDVLYDERIFIGHRLRDLEISDNYILASTDDGALVYLTRSEKVGEKPFPPVGSVTK